MAWTGRGHKRQRTTLRLYRNNRDGTFTDVTHRAGLDIEMYGMGVAVGDYNNDGFPDILDHLRWPEPAFQEHRQRHIHRRDRQAAASAADSGFSTSALWFDYDRDGLLDLFVCNYVKWSPGARCFLQPGRKAQILLHSRSLSRRDLLALPQSRRRNF